MESASKSNNIKCRMVPRLVNELHVNSFSLVLRFSLKKFS